VDSVAKSVLCMRATIACKLLHPGLRRTQTHELSQLL
jgi:hypothetical protein